MSIKLSIKDLKDLLQIQNQKIKKKKRRRTKNIKKAIPSNIKSSSNHMQSGGITLNNTSNEQTELLRLQRQAMEQKIKDDKERKIKEEEDKKIMLSLQLKIKWYLLQIQEVVIQ